MMIMRYAKDIYSVDRRTPELMSNVPFDMNRDSYAEKSLLLFKDEDHARTLLLRALVLVLLVLARLLALHGRILAATVDVQVQLFFSFSFCLVISIIVRGDDVSVLCKFSFYAVFVRVFCLHLF
mgnify:CR=1 FL=1